MLRDLLLIVGSAFFGALITAAWLGIRRQQKAPKTLYDTLVTQRVPMLVKELKGGGRVSLKDYGYSDVSIYEDKGVLRYRYRKEPNDLDGQFLVDHPQMMLTVLENEQALLHKVNDDRKQRDQEMSQWKGEIEGRSAALLD